MRDDRGVRRGGREGNADSGFQRLDAGGDFQEGRADGLEGGGAPAGLAGRSVAQIEHHPVGGGVQEQPELVGLPAMAGGSVGGKVGLVLLARIIHRRWFSGWRAWHKRLNSCMDLFAHTSTTTQTEFPARHVRRYPDPARPVTG